MNRRAILSAVVPVVLAVAGCSAPAASPTPTEPPPPASASAFSATWCLAFQEFEAAVGNDAGAMGPEAEALRDAVKSGSAPAVVAATPAVRAHVEEFGRLGRLMAAGWEPGRAFAGVAVELADRMLSGLDSLHAAAAGGELPTEPYFGEAEFALYQELFVEGRALNDRQNGALKPCS
jgi:hypothetical protein